MCILCVIQKWSRRVATMLPWLVIPLIGLWALSQMLPPPYRFEITGPRLACVFVLLVTLVWYQYLMPCLSAWRVRRNAQLRERKRFEALELQKLRKTATKRCRNCFTPYRDQNPGGGRFMCSYCGHISKRPVLDLPIPPGLGISNSGIIKELLGRGGKILNGKAWSSNSSISQDWLDHGGWVVSPSCPGRSCYASAKSGDSCLGESEQCLDEKSHPHACFLPHIWMISFLKGIRWIWRKLFSVSSLREDGSSEVDLSGIFPKSDENGLHYQESRGEKARRKAEEKRQARLERELLEEEERKQREEVGRLVEERRRLRDEKIEAENRARESCQREEKKREAEKRRQERKKDKDKSSSKSNSDVEELMDKKIGRENECKRDTDKKTETDQKECQRTGTDLVKSEGFETYSGKRSPVNNYAYGNAGTRYFDRMRGTIISSSKALTGGSLFGKASKRPTHVSKDKSYGYVDSLQSSVNRREFCPADRMQEKSPTKGDDRMTMPPAAPEPQRKTAPKSWQQLFTKSPAVSSSNTNVIGRPNTKSRSEIMNPQIDSHSPPPLTYDNPINFGFSLPFTLPTFSNGPMIVSSGLVTKNDNFPHLGERPHDLLPEEPELFEDPCYVPDPVSLLGPVSESLDNFQLDLGSGYIPQEKVKPHSLINTSVPLDTSRRSPVESPISQLRVPDERMNYFGHAPCSPKAQGVQPYASGELNNMSEKGVWQMWNSSPVIQNGLGYLGNQSNWVPPLNWGTLQKEDANPVSRKTMASLFANECHPASGIHPPQNNSLGIGKTNGAFGSTFPGSNDDLWLQSSFPEPFVDGEDRVLVKSSQQKVINGNPVRSSNNHPYDMSQASCWPQNELAMRRSNEGVGNPSVVIPNVGGGLYYTPDVQSLWSFE